MKLNDINYFDFVRCLINKKLLQFSFILLIAYSAFYFTYLECIHSLNLNIFSYLFWAITIIFAIIIIFVFTYLGLLFFRRDFDKIKDLFTNEDTIYKFDLKKYFFIDFIIIFAFSILHILFEIKAFPRLCNYGWNKVFFFCFIILCFINFLILLSLLKISNKSFRFLLFIFYLILNVYFAIYTYDNIYDNIYDDNINYVLYYAMYMFSYLIVITYFFKLKNKANFSVYDSICNYVVRFLLILVGFVVLILYIFCVDDYLVKLFKCAIN